MRTRSSEWFAVARLMRMGGWEGRDVVVDIQQAMVRSLFQSPGITTVLSQPVSWWWQYFLCSQIYCYTSKIVHWQSFTRRDFIFLFIFYFTCICLFSQIFFGGGDAYTSLFSEVEREMPHLSTPMLGGVILLFEIRFQECLENLITFSKFHSSNKSQNCNLKSVLIERILPIWNQIKYFF